MRAVIYERYGPPEVLQLRDLDEPIAGPDDVLIRVKAVEVTKSDCELRSFRFPVQWFWLPLRIAFGIRRPRRRVLGGYFAGEIVAVGARVESFKAGAEVFGCAGLRLGAYAELLALPAGFTIVSKPNKLSFAEAAAVPLGGLNALHFMRKAQIRPGQSVLINGAGGSIGTYAVQIAKSLGAQVTAVDKGMKRSMLMRLGADEFIDYTCSDVFDNGRFWDVIFDMVPRGSYRNRIASLKPGGRYLTGNPRLSVMLRALLTNWFSDKAASFAFAAESQQELQTLHDMLAAGTLEPVVDRVLPMAEIREAHRLVATEERQGAIVLSMS